MSFGKVLVGGLAKPGFGLGRVAFARHSFVPPNLDPDRTVVRTVARRFSENHLCGAKELFASPKKLLRIPPPLSIGTLRKSAENPVFSWTALMGAAHNGNGSPSFLEGYRRL